MNAADQADIAGRLAHALKVGGLTVERSRMIGGRLFYEPVPAEAFLGRILQMGLRVTYSLPGDAAAPTVLSGHDPAQVPLRLVGPGNNDHEDDGA